MGRTLCIWWPDWPLQRPDAPSDEPCIVLDQNNVVAARNQLAAKAGVAIGMPGREAEGLCPGAVMLNQDVGAEARKFEPVVALVEELIPKVEVAQPGLLFVPIKGALRYYGGEKQIVDRTAETLRQYPGARLGLAGGPFAARQAVELAGDGPLIVTDDAQFLSSLDIGALNNEDLAATFRWLGITTLGELARLPRGAMASRFGSIGLEAHRYASGEERPVAPRQIPEDLAIQERYEDPLYDLDRVGFAARALSARLVGTVRDLGVGFHKVIITAISPNQERTRVWRSADPFTEATLTERVWWQLRAWVEGEGIPGGILGLRLVPDDLSGDGRQLTLDDDLGNMVEVERSITRTQTLVGPDQVVQGQWRGGRVPHEQVRWHRWDEPQKATSRDTGTPWPGTVLGPTPALVPTDRPHLDIEWDDGMPVQVKLRSRWVPVNAWAGPWRAVGKWWVGERTVDRYQIVTSVGAFLCEIEDGRAHLIGIYD